LRFHKQLPVLEQVGRQAPALADFTKYSRSTADVKAVAGALALPPVTG
jgi:hypothetical protein